MPNCGCIRCGSLGPMAAPGERWMSHRYCRQCIAAMPPAIIVEGVPAAHVRGKIPIRVTMDLIDAIRAGR